MSEAKPTSDDQSRNKPVWTLRGTHAGTVVHDGPQLAYGFTRRVVLEEHDALVVAHSRLAAENAALREALEEAKRLADNARDLRNDGSPNAEDETLAALRIHLRDALLTQLARDAQYAGAYDKEADQ